MWRMGALVCLALLVGTLAFNTSQGMGSKETEQKRDRQKHGARIASEPMEVLHYTRENVDDFIINHVNPQTIRENLRFLTEKEHVAGTQREWALAQWVEEKWRAQGWDEVQLVPYKVLLSYPKKDTPNLVSVLNDAGEVVWTSHWWQKPLYAPEEFEPQLPNFNAYSAPGVVRAGVVYAHFGRQEDFQRLEELGVGVAGHVVLARYGAIFRGSIVQEAERRGAVGVLLYSDPQQFAPFGEDAVYPSTVYLPPSGAAAGTVNAYDGDPLTRFYPATESAYRLPEDEAALPRIPVQPLCYEDVTEILRHVGGAAAPEEWQGGLNLTYRLGPELKQAGWSVKLEIHTRNVPATIYNVVAIMHGREEPDRYVVLGNHRDAWNFGALDPSSGTAALLETSRVLAQLRTATDWHPRRSLVLCSWAAEEFGLIGSVEWTEQFGKVLGKRAVSYLNVDMAMNGNYTLRVRASPLLYDVLLRGAAKVPNPDPSEVKAGRTTVYDTWVMRQHTSEQPGKPRMRVLGGGSDYKGFQHNLGIPSADFRYTYGPDMYRQPLYHTMYETFAAVDELFDRGFHFHTAIAQLWAVMAVDLADTKVVPFSLVDYGDFVASAAASVEQLYGSLISSRNLSLEFFRATADEFAQTTIAFTNNLGDMNITNPLVARRLSDQIMEVDRAFLDPHGLPGRPQYNHVVIAPSGRNSYNSHAFVGLTDVLEGIEDLPLEEQEERWKQFSHHLGAVTHHLSSASNVLNNKLW